MVLSTGKTVEVNQNIFGIDADGRMFGGYDEYVTGECCSFHLTAQEKKEVAREIIKRATALIERIDYGEIGDDVDEFAETKNVRR